MHRFETFKRKLQLLITTGAFFISVTPAAAGAEAYVTPGVPHPGSDQIFWVPTFAQAEVVARETGRMMFVMGSVSDWNGY